MADELCDDGVLFTLPRRRRGRLAADQVADAQAELPRPIDEGSDPSQQVLAAQSKETRDQFTEHRRQCRKVAKTKTSPRAVCRTRQIGDLDHIWQACTAHLVR